MKVLKIYLVLILLAFTQSSSANHATIDSIRSAPSKVQRTDSLLHTIDLLHDKANEIEVLSEKGFNLNEIISGLPLIAHDIHTLKTSLNANIGVMDIKSLMTFASLLNDSHEQLNKWRKVLLGYNQQLVGMQTEMEALHQNTLLQSFKSDSLFVKLYTTELTSIERSWNKAKALNKRSLQEISTLQARITTYYYESGDLQKELTDQVQSYSKRVFGKEYPLLWEAQSRDMDQEALKFLSASLLIQRQLIGNYLKENIVYHVAMGLTLFGLFIYWIRRNYRRLIAENKASEWLQFTKGGSLSPWSLLPGLIIVFNLAPFFDLNPPEAYISLLQLLLFIIITIFVIKHWPKQDKVYWGKIGVAFIIFAGLNGVFNPGTGVRLAMIAINVFFAFNALYFVRNKCAELQLTRFAKTVSYIFLTLSILAIVLNLTGRVTLAKALSNAAVYGFIQVVALSIFTNIIKTAFLLQAHTASVVKNGSSVINYEKLNYSLSRFLSVVVVALWLMVFAYNMNVYDTVFELLGYFLFKARTVGSTTFTIGNILLFFFVLYLSALAQKYIGYVFGENHGEVAPGERKGSKAVITKLIILVIGFLLAVLVSGLPIDKITVVLGAFGVGIGLGLQTIVNNFVSGVILIFERPLQVGDYVEVSGYKGWVNDIGIRATRLSSSEGAEILVPNGTILSGNLVNWTLSNSNIRVELMLKVSPQAKVKEAKDLILQILNQQPEVEKNRNPEIFNQSVNESVAELKVWFWISQVSKQQTVRSNIIDQLYSTFEGHDIKLS